MKRQRLARPFSSALPLALLLTALFCDAISVRQMLVGHFAASLCSLGAIEALRQRAAKSVRQELLGRDFLWAQIFTLVFGSIATALLPHISLDLTTMLSIGSLKKLQFCLMNGVLLQMIVACAQWQYDHGHRKSAAAIEILSGISAGGAIYIARSGDVWQLSAFFAGITLMVAFLLMFDRSSLRPGSPVPMLAETPRALLRTLVYPALCLGVPYITMRMGLWTQLALSSAYPMYQFIRTALPGFGVCLGMILFYPCRTPRRRDETEAAPMHVTLMTLAVLLCSIALLPQSLPDVLTNSLTKIRLLPTNTYLSMMLWPALLGIVAALVLYAPIRVRTVMATLLMLLAAGVAFLANRSSLTIQINGEAIKLFSHPHLVRILPILAFLCLLLTIPDMRTIYCNARARRIAQRARG